jgi:RNA recognition motif-containing protein
MDVKVYVGNLSYGTTENDLHALFSEVGTVASVALIKDRATGNSKGFAFVEMSSQVEAEAVIGRFNRYMMGGREMKVNLARPREDHDRNKRSGGRYDRRY